MVAIGVLVSVPVEFDDDEGAFIMIRPADSGHRSFADSPCISMDEAFAGYARSYVPVEADWGDDVGAEVIA